MFVTIGDKNVNLDFRPDSARAAGLGALMKGAGKAPRFLPLPLVERGIEFFRAHGCDAIMAVGRGSSMDAANAIAVPTTALDGTTHRLWWRRWH